MPVPAIIANAAQNYQFNNDFLLNTVKDLSPEEWLRRPNDTSNHMAWIIGHVIWTRSKLLQRLGVAWSAPGSGLFGRGSKLEAPPAYPSPEALMAAWREVSGLLMTALENLTEEELAAPAKQPAPPTADGKESGVVNFLALHEVYHLGQASYLRSWLGHKGLMG